MKWAAKIFFISVNLAIIFMTILLLHRLSRLYAAGKLSLVPLCASIGLGVIVGVIFFRMARRTSTYKVG